MHCLNRFGPLKTLPHSNDFLKLIILDLLLYCKFYFNFIVACNASSVRFRVEEAIKTFLHLTIYTRHYDEHNFSMKFVVFLVFSEQFYLIMYVIEIPEPNFDCPHLQL